MAFALPFASEVAGLLNFLISDIILISCVMRSSSVIAGYLNHLRMRTIGTVHLVPFDFPHIGGGIVMDYGWQRRLLIFLRATAVLAVVIGNFGLEGRSIDVSERHVVPVRVPGTLDDVSVNGLFEATERRMRCSVSVGDSLTFGAVLNGTCFANNEQHVYVRKMALVFEQFNYTVTGCRKESVCDTFYTVYRCKDTDFACAGVDDCPDQFPGSQVAFCYAVIYGENDSFLCDRYVLTPQAVNAPVSCRRVDAKRQDIQGWVTLMFGLTLDPVSAIFATAYGRRILAQVDMPQGERNVTLVTLFWIISECWLVGVCFVLVIWELKHHLKGGLKHVANDERGLAMLLDRALQLLEKRSASGTTRSSSELDSWSSDEFEYEEYEI